MYPNLDLTESAQADMQYGELQKVKFTLEQAIKPQRGSGGITVLFIFDLGTWGWVVNAMPRLLYPCEIDPEFIVWEAGWVPGSVWKGAQNLAPPGFDFRTTQPVVS